MSEVINNVDPSENYDAQQAIEEIAVGDRKAPAANVEADYETSKQFSTSAIDQTDEGANAAEAATASKLELPEPDESLVSGNSTGNPDDYKQMARDLSSTSDTASSASSDDLYKKAMEKGKAGA